MGDGNEKNKQVLFFRRTSYYSFCRNIKMFTSIFKLKVIKISLSPAAVSSLYLCFNLVDFNYLQKMNIDDESYLQ